MTRTSSLPATAVSAVSLDFVSATGSVGEHRAHGSRRVILTALLVAATAGGALAGTAVAEPLPSGVTAGLPDVVGSLTPGSSVPGEAEAPAVALDTPRLASADNFRDLAGTDHAYAAGDSTLRPGVVYRSNALDLSDADLATLEGLGIGTVVDLRTDSEVETTPDRVPEGADYHHISVFGQGDNAADTSVSVETPEDAAALLEEANVQFVEDDQVRQNLGEVVRTIAGADGPVVFHCTAGKDRAGWVSAVLQLAAGVSREDVMANYLATNDYTKARVDATVEQVRAAKGDQTADAYAVLLGVQPEFLQAGLDAMDREYGGVDGYLADGLGLDAATVQQLTAKLVA